MAHHLDHSVGSDLSYEIAQFRRQHPELVAADRDSSNQRLRSVPCVFDGYAADRAAIRDSYQGESKLILAGPMPFYPR